MRDDDDVTSKNSNEKHVGNNSSKNESDHCDNNRRRKKRRRSSFTMHVNNSSSTNNNTFDNNVNSNSNININRKKNKDIYSNRPIMGTSFNFETGGPVYQRPKSLICVPPYGTSNSDDINDGDGNGEPKRRRQHREQRLYSSLLSGESLTSKSGRKFDKPITKTHHFAGLPIPIKRLGVCGECGGAGSTATTDQDSSKDNNNNNNNNNKCRNNNGGDVIVLCDGIGCNREFHLQCCRPPLQQIPEQDEYYCFDCHPKGGSTELLIEYFDDVERSRESHEEKCWKAEYKLDQEQERLRIKQQQQQQLYQRSRNSVNATTNNETNSRPRQHHRQVQKKLSQRNKRIKSSQMNSTTNDNSKHLTFVDELVLMDIKESQLEWSLQENKNSNGIATTNTNNRNPPRSELEMFLVHNQSWDQFKDGKQNHRKKEESKGGYDNDVSTGVVDRCTNTQYKHLQHRHHQQQQQNYSSDYLVGSAIRLYCPKTNQYHTGRIVRVGTEEVEGDRKKTDQTLNCHDTECLVRFQAGRDYRKTSLTRWIRLEEHSLAVASRDLVLAKFDNDVDRLVCGSTKKRKKRRSRQHQHQLESMHRWMPAKLWMRSSRELVMSMRLLDEELGQIKYRNWRYRCESQRSLSSSSQQQQQHLQGEILDGQNVDASKTVERVGSSGSPLTRPIDEVSVRQEWILAECIGRGIYKLVQALTETKEHSVFDATTLCTTTNAAAGKKMSKDNKNKRRQSKSFTNSNLISQQEDQIMVALEIAEVEEQQRVRQWNNLPLENIWHNKAVTCQDEAALGPLTYGENRSFDNDDTNEEISINNTIVIDPTPLVRTGLDRMYIMNEFVTTYNFDNANSYYRRTNIRDIACSKDLAIGMSCGLVFNDSIASCIQQQNAKDRLNQKQPDQQQQIESKHKEMKGVEADGNPYIIQKQNEADVQIKIECDNEQVVQQVAAQNVFRSEMTKIEKDIKEEKVRIDSKTEVEGKINVRGKVVIRNEQNEPGPKGIEMRETVTSTLQNKRKTIDNVATTKFITYAESQKNLKNTEKRIRLDGVEKRAKIDLESQRKLKEEDSAAAISISKIIFQEKKAKYIRNEKVCTEFSEESRRSGKEEINRSTFENKNYIEREPQAIADFEGPKDVTENNVIISTTDINKKECKNNKSDEIRVYSSEPKNKAKEGKGRNNDKGNYAQYDKKSKVQGKAATTKTVFVIEEQKKLGDNEGRVIVKPKAETNGGKIVEEGEKFESQGLKPDVAKNLSNSLIRNETTIPTLLSRDQEIKIPKELRTYCTESKYWTITSNTNTSNDNAASLLIDRTTASYRISNNDNNNNNERRRRMGQRSWSTVSVSTVASMAPTCLSSLALTSKPATVITSREEVNDKMSKRETIEYETDVVIEATSEKVAPLNILQSVCMSDEKSVQGKLQMDHQKLIITQILSPSRALQKPSALTSVENTTASVITDSTSALKDISSPAILREEVGENNIELNKIRQVEVTPLQHTAQNISTSTNDMSLSESSLSSKAVLRIMGTTEKATTTASASVEVSEEKIS